MPQSNKTNFITRIYRIVAFMTYTFLIFWKVYATQKKYGSGSPELNQLVMTWARTSLGMMGVKTKEIGSPHLAEPVIFVSNHVSFLDIGIWMSRVPSSFLAKQSVRYWPIIGKGAEIIGTVFVQRNSDRSRAKAVTDIGKSVRDNKKSLVIFPEGTSSLEGKVWKWGAFKIAEDNQLKIQPGLLTYSHPLEQAYINNENFFQKLWKIVGLRESWASLEFFDPIEVTDHRSQSVEVQNMIHSRQRADLQTAGIEV